MHYEKGIDCYPGSASHSHSVDVLSTDVATVKEGPPTAEVGEDITYTYTVTNPGEVALVITSLVDTPLGDVSGFYFDGEIGRAALRDSV